MSAEAESRALRLGLARGYLTSSQVEQARRSAPPGQVLPRLAHLLDSSQLEELRRAYAGQEAPPSPLPAPGEDATLAPGTPGAEPVLETQAQRPAPARAASLPQPGELVAGAYEVLRLLGRGGMGAVYLARDRVQREVALKIQLRSRGTERFRTEGQAVARLRHPGIVPIHDLGVDEAGRNYCVMGYVPGGALEDQLGPEGRLAPREAARITRDVAAALAYAHEEGVLHRDIKPANLLLTPDGEVVVTDFGLAKIVDQSHQLSKTGDFLGTPAYMSPEQARGEVSRIGPGADIYSVGATLYSLLTGRPPFYDMPPIQLLMSVANLPPNPPSTLRPELDAALDAICMRCLEKAPEDRYADMGALAADLSAYLDVGASGVAALARARAQRTRRRGLWTLLALAFLVPGAALLLAFTTPATSRAPEPAGSARPSRVEPQRAEAPRPLVEAQPLELLPGEQASFSAEPADFALIVRLEGPPEAELRLSAPLQRARVRCEAGWALPLTLARKGRFPLQDGAHLLQLDPQASGPVTLRLRRIADEKAVPRRTSRAHGLGVLPRCEDAFNTASASEAAERVLASLRAEAAEVRRWQRPRLVKGALAQLRQLAEGAGTPLAPLLIEGINRHLPTDPIAPERPAEVVAERLLAQAPEDFSVRYYCALARSRAGQAREAARHWLRCRELEPADVEVRSNLLASLLVARRYEEVEREGEQLLAIRPRHTEALGFLLLAKLWQGTATPAEAARCAHMSYQITRSRRMLPFLESLDALLAGGTLQPAGEPSLSPEHAAELARVYLLGEAKMARRLSRLTKSETVHWDKLIRVRCTRLVKGRDAAQRLLERHALELGNSRAVKQRFERLQRSLR